MDHQVNTLNICLGHLPFPMSHWCYADLMVAPKMIIGHQRLAIVPDELYGPNGSALSEYAQLFWLHENLSRLMHDLEFVRVFHYRRFVSSVKPNCGRKSSNLFWATTITNQELDNFSSEFSRTVEREVFNTPIKIPNGVMDQYRVVHVLEDLLRFGAFLAEKEILDSASLTRFMRSDVLIPSCNIGVFRSSTFHDIFTQLRQASQFLSSPFFIPRDGYQRRNLGFLLERLHSHLILERLTATQSPFCFGHNMVLSDSEVVTITT